MLPVEFGGEGRALAEQVALMPLLGHRRRSVHVFNLPGEVSGVHGDGGRLCDVFHRAREGRRNPVGKNVSQSKVPRLCLGAEGNRRHVQSVGERDSG